MWLDDDGSYLNSHGATFKGIESYITAFHSMNGLCRLATGSMLVPKPGFKRDAVTPLSLEAPCYVIEGVRIEQLSNAIFDDYCVFNWTAFEDNGLTEHNIIRKNKRSLLAAVLVHPVCGRKAFHLELLCNYFDFHRC